MELKIGILLPRSEMFPTLAMDFLNGLKLALKTINISISTKFIVESIGNATDKALPGIAEKMILQEEVDLTISFCSVHKLLDLTAIYNAYKKPLVHADLGGNILKKKHVSPYVLNHSLNLWQAAYSSGKYAANTFGKKAALAVSFYDGGYNIADAFVKGFTENGGEIPYTYVSPEDYKSESFETMLQGIKETEPDFVFNLFSFKEGAKVMDVLSQSEINGKIPLIAIPLLTDESYYTQNYDIKEFYSVASWAFDEKNPQMENFQKNYTTVYDEQANIIALLGFEIGLSISYCLNDLGKIQARIGEYFTSKTLETPRGKVFFNDYNESQASLYKIRKFEFNGTQYHNTVIGTIEENPQKLYADFETRPYTGWQNPYICT